MAGTANRTIQGLLANRTTTGRDFVKLPGGVPCLTMLFINITGGTATVDIEISDDPTKPDPLVFFPIKTVEVKSVHRISMPSSVIAVNVTAISGATVDVRYRILVLDNAPEYAIDTFEEGDITARKIQVEGSLDASMLSTAFRKKLAQALVAATPTTIYTVPADRQTAIRSIHISNTDSVSRTVSLYHDGSAATNTILPPVTILAGGFAVFSGEISMEPTDTLVADADAAGVVAIHVTGLEEPLPS